MGVKSHLTALCLPREYDPTLSLPRREREQLRDPSPVSPRVDSDEHG